MKLPNQLQIEVDADASSLVQMLAFSLELRAYLSAGYALEVVLPHNIFSTVPTEVFEELIFDNLSQITPQLDKMLSIHVKAVNYFSIEITQPIGR